MRSSPPRRSLRSAPFFQRSHLSRSFLLATSLAAASMVGCASSESSSAEAPAPSTQSPSHAAVAEPLAAVRTDGADAENPGSPASATTPEAGPHRHHGGPFEHLEALDLRAEQRVAIAEIKANLHASLEPSRREGRDLANLLAGGIEAGKLDEGVVREKRIAVNARITEARKALGDAANAVHATLDADQRQELVLTLRARRAGQPTPNEQATDARPPRAHRVGRLASELGLSADQTRSLQDGARAIFEAAFPDRKARREQLEEERKAAETAFMTDSFDAHRYTFGRETTQFLQIATSGVTKLSDLAATVLSPAQRVALADKIREGSGE